MKVITIKQPHAGAIFTTPILKAYETRSWATSYRGPLAIHAGKRLDDDAAVARWEAFTGKTAHREDAIPPKRSRGSRPRR